MFLKNNVPRFFEVQELCWSELKDAIESIDSGHSLRKGYEKDLFHFVSFVVYIDIGTVSCLQPVTVNLTKAEITFYTSSIK